MALNKICLVKLDEHVTSLGFIMNVSHFIPDNTCDVIVSLISGGNGILVTRRNEVNDCVCNVVSEY